MTDTNEAGATPANSPVDKPGNAILPRPSIGVARLASRTLLRVTGPGTVAFLQGQFSQHLDDVSETRAPRAAASTPKGRAYALARLYRLGDDVLVDLPTALADDVLGRLRKYLMLFRGTTMAPVDGAMVWGLIGEDAARALDAAATEALAAPGDARTLAAGVLIRVEPDDRGVSRYQFWQLPAAGADAPNWGALPRLEEADWAASEIAAGIPELSPRTQEAFVPQMLNWQHLGGVHFRKGCYTGQEVIARMHFLGQLKKSLARFSAPMPVDPEAPIQSGDRTVGDLITQVRFADGSAELLAVIRHDALDQSLAIAGTSLTRQPLPYAVPEQAAADT
ncbi:CAF17-like 4Fe-4S cluster assembly/insertion protein YgfZ [Marinobacter sp. C2H3]|uniref:CAF17-like 4Fe-4S cluster assembly/insertion protein YgfZ n=1 Tax=Marinobacter sp. C2H3 TaxID=3119003 RepID=UPI00300E8CD6